MFTINEMRITPLLISCCGQNARLMLLLNRDKVGH